jgi:hypothetical protein
MTGGDPVLITRNGDAPRVHREATVAASASIVVNVETYPPR